MAIVPASPCRSSSTARPPATKGTPLLTLQQHAMLMVAKLAGSTSHPLRKRRNAHLAQQGRTRIKPADRNAHLALQGSQTDSRAERIPLYALLAKQASTRRILGLRPAKSALPITTSRRSSRPSASNARTTPTRKKTQDRRRTTIAYASKAGGQKREIRHAVPVKAGSTRTSRESAAHSAWTVEGANTLQLNMPFQRAHAAIVARASTCLKQGHQTLIAAYHVRPIQTQAGQRSMLKAKTTASVKLGLATGHGLPGWRAKVRRTRQACPDVER